MQNTPVRRSGMNPQMIIGALAAIYGISPIDVIPDFIPIAGQMDDVMVIIGAIVLMLLITMMQQGGGNE
jgi:uncharacterized membrane protein YkvA (DUF1232 family)